MTSSARVQAAIEILDLVITSARANGPPADRIMADWFRSHRFAGSGDRRAVRELAFQAIRGCGELPATGRSAMLRMAQGDLALAALFDGSRHGPQPIDPAEPVAAAGLAPGWLEAALAASGIAGEEAEALLSRAPLDLRINTLKGGRDSLDVPVDAAPTLARNAIRLPPGTPVEQWDAYREGRVEIQDSASQLVCEAMAARPGETIIDLCAGAGGKTLALAASMENQGRLIACDIDRGRLSRLGPRAERAGATMIETLLLDPSREAAALGRWLGAADAVLVDAPCSGSGTWRRNPEARWRLTHDALARYSTVQQRLLGLGAALVRPGGRMTYVVCSLLDAEGAQAIEAFLSANPGWAPLPRIDTPGEARGAGVRLDPARTGTDGFFFATLRRL